MILLFILVTPWIYAISILPFFIIHLLSDFTYLVIYRCLGYRVKVVRDNIEKSFPEKTAKERLEIEKKFYSNFCDLIFEVIKTFTISKKALRERCTFKTPEFTQELWAQQVCTNGISGHLANWEWMALACSLEFKHQCYGVYKPLSNQYFDRLIRWSRQRFGIRMISPQTLKEILKSKPDKPFMMGLLADQAPHHYGASFEVPFLHRKSFFFSGPGVITVQKGYVPIWGWMKRTGRSRFEWGVDPMEFGLLPQKTEAEVQQIARIAEHHQLSLEDAERAYSLTLLFSQRLEEAIKMAPQDWLWSHRRWKKR